MTMYLGTLCRVENGEALRTNTVEGWFYDLPTVGEAFVFLAKPIDPVARVRQIRTSVVQYVAETAEGHYIFKTVNSVYAVTGVRPALKK